VTKVRLRAHCTLLEARAAKLLSHQISARLGPDYTLDLVGHMSHGSPCGAGFSVPPPGEHEDVEQFDEWCV